MRGRNRFMGYFKNDDETCKAIDRKGFVHSGDEGRIDSRGILYITGRIKELIVTAGGENIPPVLIENEIIKALSIVSQVVVIGDMRKYLSCLICLKLKDPNNPKELAEEVIEVLKK
jgi:long-chain-fatty-acid--CoA ligase ACSBG